MFGENVDVDEFDGVACINLPFDVQTKGIYFKSIALLNFDFSELQKNDCGANDRYAAFALW